jgi:integrase
MICTGINEAELAALEVSDLNLTEPDRPTMQVRAVKWGVERTLPLYDELLFTGLWLKDAIVALLREMEIKSGPVMRGFVKGGKKSSARPISDRAIEAMLLSYPIRNQDTVPSNAVSPLTVSALDLRRTLARRLYQAGISAETIQENLGPKSITTTLEYIEPPPQWGVPEDNSRIKVGPLRYRFMRWGL